MLFSERYAVKPAAAAEVLPGGLGDGARTKDCRRCSWAGCVALRVFRRDFGGSIIWIDLGLIEKLDGLLDVVRGEMVMVLCHGWYSSVSHSVKARHMYSNPTLE
jgi:hypothetical protein